MTGLAVDRAVAAMRALLTDDMSAFRDLHTALNGDDRRAFAALLTAVFNSAVNAKFSKNYSVTDVVDFVATARAQYVGPETVAAEDAERVIRAMLGEEELVEAMDSYTYGAAQTAMLLALVRQGGASGDEIEGLLDRAAAQVRSFLERQAR